MKIFFLHQKQFRLLSFKTLSRALLVSLLSCLVISQTVTHLFEPASEVSSPDVSPGYGQVLIFSSPLGKDDKVFVYVDGKNEANLVDNRAELIIDKDSAIEIMSETDRNFTVTLVGGDNIEFVGKTENAECTKGINYICRCIVN